jgi:hypothetical protein
MTKTTRTPRHMGTTPVPVEQVAQSILLLRGKRVILDRELAAIYGVPTGRLNEAVKRNIERFPEDFMFQLTRAEAELSRSQSAILNSGRGQRRSRNAGFELGQICFDCVQNTERMYDRKPLPRTDVLIIDQDVRLGQERNEQRFDSQLSRS